MNLSMNDSGGGVGLSVTGYSVGALVAIVLVGFAAGIGIAVSAGFIVVT